MANQIVITFAIKLMPPPLGGIAGIAHREKLDEGLPRRRFGHGYGWPRIGESAGEVDRRNDVRGGYSKPRNQDFQPGSGRTSTMPSEDFTRTTRFPCW